ncbi:hypothetical protein [Arsenophonus sp. PmNCSU2021_1]
MQCREKIEEAALMLATVTKSGMDWALSLPLIRLYRHCQQATHLLQRE